MAASIPQQPQALQPVLNPQHWLYSFGQFSKEIFMRIKNRDYLKKIGDGVCGTAPQKVHIKKLAGKFDKHSDNAAIDKIQVPHSPVGEAVELAAVIIAKRCNLPVPTARLYCNLSGFGGRNQ